MKLNISKSIILGLLLNICTGLQILPHPPRLQFQQDAFGKPLPVAVKQISSDLFSCNSTNTIKKSFCTLALNKINAELIDAGIAIDKDGLLFNFEKSKDETIPTGHSCSVTAKLTHQRASARFENTSTLKFQGTSLSEPIAIRLRLPVRLYARLDVHQRFGIRFFGRCRHYASDSYYFTGNLYTESDTIVAISFNPSLTNVSTTHYAFVIKPVAVVMFALENTDISFSAHGVGRLTPFWTFVKGIGSSILRSVAALFKGNSVTEAFSKSSAWKLGAIQVLGNREKLSEYLFKSDYAKFQIQKRVAGYGADIQDKLNEELRKALKVGTNGERTILISNAYAEALLA